MRPASVVHHDAQVKLLAACLVVLAGCGGHANGDIDSLIGDACLRDTDCDSRCYIDSRSFPGGFCSNACTTDADCPPDALCMEKSGGMCLYACPAFDCSRLGPGWACKDKDRMVSGNATVCIGD